MKSLNNVGHRVLAGHFLSPNKVPIIGNGLHLIELLGVRSKGNSNSPKLQKVVQISRNELNLDYKMISGS